VLEAFGIPALDERVYHALLLGPRQTAAGLLRSVPASEAAIRRSLVRLESEGLVSRLPVRPTRFVAVRPDEAIDALAGRRDNAVTAARTAAAALLPLLPTGDGPQSPAEQIEIVFGREAVAARFLQLQRGAHDELLVLDRPPYAQDPQQPNPGEDDLLRRGVRLRAIYAPEAFDVPGALDLLADSIAAGEEARTADVPLKLAIADRAAAILPFAGGRSDSADSALVVYASTLLDALVRLFDLLWAAAVPIELGTLARGESPTTRAPGGDTGARPDAFDERLLALLAAGLKDEAIARQLGVSLRTVHRRASALMAELGARTRFQAGVLAARRGVLG
jgi:sugar-specific transcriptional regulator TrmB/DNA-binding CsgD family transcriptional regulator